MKKIIGIILLFLISMTSFGQDKKVDEVMNKWIDSFNKQNFQSAYDLYASFYKEKVSLALLTSNMKNTYVMMGKLKSIKFLSYKDHVYRYVLYAKANQIEADVTVVVNQDYEIRYLTFDKIGGTGNPPPMSKGSF